MSEAVEEAMTAVDDALLHFQLCRGNELAYRDLYRKHERRVYAHALVITRDIWDAEDVVVAAFQELWRKRSRITLVNGSVLPWLLKTASYAGKNLLRTRRRHARLLRHLPKPESVQDHAESIQEALEFAQLNGELREAILQLTARETAIVALCLIEGMSMKEAAVVLEIPEGTVKSRLSRARGKLRTLLGEEFRFKGVGDER